MIDFSIHSVIIVIPDHADAIIHSPARTIKNYFYTTAKIENFLVIYRYHIVVVDIVFRRHLVFTL